MSRWSKPKPDEWCAVCGHEHKDHQGGKCPGGNLESRFERHSKTSPHGQNPRTKSRWDR